MYFTKTMFIPIQHYSIRLTFDPRILTGEKCDREGELDQQSIFEATFRKILVLLH